jgi:transposase
MKYLKQIVGIDVARNELVVTLGRMREDLSIELCARKTFANDKNGFWSLVCWAKKLTDSSVSVRYVMEATGAYHELLAYYLVERGDEVSIILPSKISNYVRTLETKTVTDKTSADAIARFGLERQLDRWRRPSLVYATLRQLTRERNQLLDEQTVAKNQLHAELAGALVNKQSVKRLEERLALCARQSKEIVAELSAVVKADKKVGEQVVLLCSIPGIGFLTAVTLLGETNGFDLIRTSSQLTSYAGLDVREKQSGTSVKGQSKISKRGNKHIRKALYFPAWTAIRVDERYKSLYQRIVSRTGKTMKGAVAVQRKILEMAYTVFSTGVKYDKQYLAKQEAQAKAAQEAQATATTGQPTEELSTVVATSPAAVEKPSVVPEEPQSKGMIRKEKNILRLVKRAELVEQ